MSETQWWRCKRSEADLIKFGWAWWDVPSLLIPDYYRTMVLGSFYRQFGAIRADIT